MTYNDAVEKLAKADDAYQRHATVGKYYRDDMSHSDRTEHDAKHNAYEAQIDALRLLINEYRRVARLLTAPKIGDLLADQSNPEQYCLPLTPFSPLRTGGRLMGGPKRYHENVEFQIAKARSLKITGVA